MKVSLLLLAVACLAASQSCPTQQIHAQTTDGYHITCSINYHLDELTDQCRVTSCYNSCPSQSAVYSDESFCKDQCPYVKICPALRVGDTDGDGDGSPENEKSQNHDGSGSSGLGLGAILGIIGGALGVLFLIVIIICTCRKNSRQNRPRQNLPPGSIDGRSDEKDIYLPEMVNSEANITHGTVCSICILEKANVALKCGHLFHPKCIFTWMKKNETCPLCRQKVKKNFKISCRKCFCPLGTRLILREGDNFRCEKCDISGDNSADCSDKGMKQQIPL